MRVHLRIQGPLGNRPLQIIDQATATEHFRFNDDLAALGPRALAARLAPLPGPGTGP